jgi:hypothetical protein
MNSARKEDVKANCQLFAELLKVKNLGEAIQDKLRLAWKGSWRQELIEVIESLSNP